jgi:DNA-binding winged helix-turn-helix (wHTH) protein
MNTTVYNNNLTRCIQTSGSALADEESKHETLTVVTMTREGKKSEDDP